MVTAAREGLLDSIPAWTEDVAAWRAARRPLAEVRTRHVVAGLEDLSACLQPGGRLRVEVEHRGRHREGELDLADPQLWAQVERLAESPPPMPAGPTPEGFPVLTISLVRDDGTALTIGCTSGTFVRSQEHDAAQALLLAIDEHARQALERWEKEEELPEEPPEELRGLPEHVASAQREQLAMLLPGWRAARARWLAGSGPLAGVHASHSTYRVETLTVSLDRTGQLGVQDDGADPVMRTVDEPALWGLAERVAGDPPLLPAGAPPPGSPGESLTLVRADGTSLAITCTPGSYVHGPQHDAAATLVARIIGLGREALGRPAVRWPGPGPEPMPNRPTTGWPPPPGFPPPPPSVG